MRQGQLQRKLNPDRRTLVTSWLADHLDDPNVRILDVTAKLTSRLKNRAKTDCYIDAHLPLLSWAVKTQDVSKTAESGAPA